MYFKRILDTSVIAEYRVICGDVAPNGEWLEVGKIVIDKQARTYDFSPLGRWLEERVIPPKVFALPANDVKAVCSSDYDGYGWGAWSARIHEWTSMLIQDGRYPDQAPQHR